MATFKQAHKSSDHVVLVDELDPREAFVTSLGERASLTASEGVGSIDGRLGGHHAER